MIAYTVIESVDASGTKEKTWWDWFHEREAEAKATETGRQLLTQGWYFQHTGGGCLAWALDIGEPDKDGNKPYCVYLADIYQGVVSSPDESVWGASLGDFHSGEDVTETGDAKTISEVLAIVNRWRQQYGSG
jgi:hypothetical protein